MERDDLLKHWGMPGMKWKKHKKKKNDDDLKDKLRSLIKKAKSRTKKVKKAVVKTEHKVEKKVKAKVRQIKKNHEARKKQKAAVKQLSRDLDKAMKGTTRNPMVLAEEKAKAEARSQTPIGIKDRARAKRKADNASRARKEKEAHSVKGRLKAIKKTLKTKEHKVKNSLKKTLADIKLKNKETVNETNVFINGQPVSKVKAQIKANNKIRNNPERYSKENMEIKKLSNKQKRERIKKIWKDVPDADFKDKMKFQGSLFPKKKKR